MEHTRHTGTAAPGFGVKYPPGHPVDMETIPDLAKARAAHRQFREAAFTLVAANATRLKEKLASCTTQVSLSKRGIGVLSELSGSDGLMRQRLVG